jgi:hypothetical protein
MSSSNEIEILIPTLTPAERMYKNHLKQVSLYQKRNPEKMRSKCKKYIENLKENAPLKYEALLQQKRNYYKTVTKPNLEKLKLLKEQKNQ